MDHTLPHEATPTSYTKTLVKTKLLYMYFVHDVGLKGHVLFFFIIIFIVYQARHNAMPALTANSVTLDEILEVRAGPLKEEELWAILSHASEALQDVLIKGITVKCSIF